MTIYDNLFPLGIGTNRFSVKDASDEAGIEAAVRLVSEAIKAGCSYIDVASSYSKGYASEICRQAFTLAGTTGNVTIKSSFLTDVTVNDALRRLESEFHKLDISHASYFTLWNIASYEQFVEIMRKGSLYDGAVEAKKQGLVDHICFSSHAKPEEIVKMLESGAFEGATIAFSPLNSLFMQPVLEAAEKHSVGLAVMNPLGGGVVAQADSYFSFLQNSEDRNTAVAALRYVFAHPAVKIILSGMSTLEQLHQNLSAFLERDPEPPEKRIERVNKEMFSLPGYCTGCRYCMPCPSGIDIPAFMQSRNSTLFPLMPMYNRTNPDVLHDVQLFRKLQQDFSILPQNSVNTCIECGACEKKCTQHLSIRHYVKEIYESMERSGFSVDARRERLDRLLNQKKYRRIGFYPGALYTAKILEMYVEFFGTPPFEYFLFDSNCSAWGTEMAGVLVRAPKEIPTLELDAIIITNFNYLNEIYDKVVCYKEYGVDIIKLHEDADVPWIF